MGDDRDYCQPLDEGRVGTDPELKIDDIHDDANIPSSRSSTEYQVILSSEKNQGDMASTFCLTRYSVDLIIPLFIRYLPRINERNVVLSKCVPHSSYCGVVTVHVIDLPI